MEETSGEREREGQSPRTDRQHYNHYSKNTVGHMQDIQPTFSFSNYKNRLLLQFWEEMCQKQGQEKMCVFFFASLECIF